ncbi:MAG: Lrp/AsnC family transcriptional regulator [Thermoplasmata archaeon]|nr:Lrp/AsnC family transcriptional regulator [Thermoplasmata archaeon]
MVKKDLKSSRKLGVVNCLLEDPTQGMSKIAEKTSMHRRTAWQIQKDLEKDTTIWGYTAVIDEQKIDRAIYVLQFQAKPFSKDFADLILHRLTLGEPMKAGVRILDIYFMNGPYDVFIKFSAPDHATARRYYETLRSVYKDYFLEAPLVSDVNFSLVQAGKLNPELKKIYDLVPKATAE